MQPKPPGRMFRIALIAGWIAVLGCLFVNAARRVGGQTGDFVHFFAAAKAMVHGQDIYTSGIGWYIYPPLLAFLYTPLASLPQSAAATILLVCNMTLMLLSVFLATREFAYRFGARIGAWTTCAVALTAVLLTADKLKGELQMWQTNMLLLFLFTSALCLLDRRPWLAGLVLGFAFNIKYWPVVLVPYLLLRRRWTTAAAFAASIMAFALLPAVETGWNVNLRNQAVAYRGLLRVVGLPVGRGRGRQRPEPRGWHERLHPQRGGAAGRRRRFPQGRLRRRRPRRPGGPRRGGLALSAKRRGVFLSARRLQRRRPGGPCGCRPGVGGTADGRFAVQPTDQSASSFLAVVRADGGRLAATLPA